MTILLLLRMIIVHFKLINGGPPGPLNCISFNNTTLFSFFPFPSNPRTPRGLELKWNLVFCFTLVLAEHAHLNYLVSAAASVSSIYPHMWTQKSLELAFSPSTSSFRSSIFPFFLSFFTLNVNVDFVGYPLNIATFRSLNHLQLALNGYITCFRIALFCA